MEAENRIGQTDYPPEPELELFTDRQLEVFGLVLQGKTHRQIALALNITIKTVEGLIYGQRGPRSCKSRANLGIYGIIENQTGIKPNLALVTLFGIRYGLCPNEEEFPIEINNSMRDNSI